MSKVKQMERRWVFLLLLLLVAISTVPVRADGGGQELPEGVGFDQNLDAQLPLDLTFQDEEGTVVQLGDYFGQKPAVLQLGYYECPMLCGLVFKELADRLRELDEFNVGDEFNVISVSIDPGETPQIAARKKALHVQQVGRAGVDEGWHFLTGQQEAIQKLAQTIGFHYLYDEEIDQYAHPSGVVIVTPEGKIARYLYGIDYALQDLRLGLVQASDNKIGSPVDQVLLLCYQYDPVTGQYTFAIMNVLRLVSLATVVVLGGALLVMYRRN
jgi:protein SCO1/2